jgi:hypothetical protein
MRSSLNFFHYEGLMGKSQSGWWQLFAEFMFWGSALKLSVGLRGKMKNHQCKMQIANFRAERRRGAISVLLGQLKRSDGIASSCGSSRYREEGEIIQDGFSEMRRL